VSARLSARGLVVRYGGLHALDGVDLDVAPGEIVGLVGGNGAGKTTLLGCLSGHVHPQEGRVLLDGVDISRWRADARAGSGVIRTFQDARLFGTMRAGDVLLLAGERAEHSGLLGSLCATPGWRRAERRRVASVRAIAARVGLEPFLDVAVAQLSTGVRHLLELACAVSLRASVLLLDEPSSGLASAELGPLEDVIRGLRADTAASIVMVEHDLALVARLADAVVVLEEGHVRVAGAAVVLPAPDGQTRS